MARVVVDVMLKPEILDPQGQAVANALPRLGIDDVSSVRIGRRIEIEFTGEPDLERAREIAHKLLANPVIEDFAVALADPADREGVSVEENDPACSRGMIEDVKDGGPSAERVADDKRLRESKPPVEVVDELHPMGECVGAASLRESERRNVKREHSVVSSEQGADLVPNPARFGGAAE